MKSVRVVGRGCSKSPGHWRGQGRRKRSPVRERSEERHAKIAQWNQAREQHENAANKVKR